MARVSNRQVRAYVERKEPFTTHNGALYGRREGDLYVVYSYGPHWPLFVFDALKQVWLETITKHSVTTTRHRNHASPWSAKQPVIPAEVQTVKAYVHSPDQTYREVICKRLTGAVVA